MFATWLTETISFWIWISIIKSNSRRWCSRHRHKYRRRERTRERVARVRVGRPAACNPGVDQSEVYLPRLYDHPGEKQGEENCMAWLQTIMIPTTDTLMVFIQCISFGTCLARSILAGVTFAPCRNFILASMAWLSEKNYVFIGLDKANNVRGSY